MIINSQRLTWSDRSKTSRQNLIPCKLTLEYPKNTGNTKTLYKKTSGAFTQRNEVRKMAENRDRDNEGGIDATDFAADGLLQLPLGELGRKDHFGTAIANKKFILEIAQMLKSLGDVEIEQQIAEERKKLKRHISLKEYFSTASLTKILQTLDFALEWLEQSTKKSIDDEAGKQNSETNRPILRVDQTDTGSTVIAGDQQQDRDQYQKKESVLRGLFYVIGKHCGLYLRQHLTSKGLPKQHSDCHCSNSIFTVYFTSCMLSWYTGFLCDLIFHLHILKIKLMRI